MVAGQEWSIQSLVEWLMSSVHTLSGHLTSCEKPLFGLILDACK